MGGEESVLESPVEDPVMMLEPEIFLYLVDRGVDANGKWIPTTMQPVWFFRFRVTS